MKATGVFFKNYSFVIGHWKHSKLKNAITLWIALKMWISSNWNGYERIHSVRTHTYIPAKLFDTSRTPFCRQQPSNTPTTRFWLPILPMRLKWSTTLSNTNGCTITLFTTTFSDGIFAYNFPLGVQNFKIDLKRMRIFNVELRAYLLHRWCANEFPTYRVLIWQNRIPYNHKILVFCAVKK